MKMLNQMKIKMNLQMTNKIEEDNIKDEEVDESIESIPFISEPVKKKRTRTH